MQALILRNNQLMTLPKSLGQLSSLNQLEIQYNPLETIPEVIANLKKLKMFFYGGNKSENLIDVIPNWFRFLVELERFGIGYTNLKEIPTWINELAKLREIQLPDNEISDIPSSISQLKYLDRIWLDNNPLNPALQSANEQGLPAVMAYLRSLEGNAEPLYEAKLVLVGEGGVGKTTLLNALMKKEDRTPKVDEKTTHGVKIDVDALQLPHPEKEGVKIQLNAWDFGGQDVYRVTHQFFFSRRSLYLLVWEPRRGVQQCQVEDWLNMIRLRVGNEARVIIVSTYSKSGEHLARIDQPVFKQQYGDMIVSFHEVDSLVPDEKTGEMVGIAELKKIIAEHAAQLEQMGMLFNNNWKTARDELLALSEPRISYATFSGICAKHGLSQIDTDTLAHLMNDLGYIVHYSDDEKLRDDVVLKPRMVDESHRLRAGRPRHE